MKEPWRRLALAAAITVTVGVSAASAQTAIVRNAPPGSRVELVLNVQTVGSATVGPDGVASVTANPPVPVSKIGTDAHLYLETCTALRRVLIIERSKPGAEQPGDCTRKLVVDWVVLRRVTTLVLDVGGANPTVAVSQGPAPEEWLRAEAAGSSSTKKRWPAHTGFMVHGSVGLGSLSNAVGLACGNVSDCSGENSRFTYSAGLVYWVIPYLALDANYLKTRTISAQGSGDTFGFSSALKLDIGQFGIKLGVPVGPARFYGLAGASYTQATLSTTQTFVDTQVTVDGNTITIPGGGTQVFDLPTRGWGWYAGGGIELWATNRIALFGEGGRVTLRGKTGGAAEGSLDDRSVYALFGVRLRVGGLSGRK